MSASVDAYLAEVGGRCENATTGPWTCCHANRDLVGGCPCGLIIAGDMDAAVAGVYGPEDEDRLGGPCASAGERVGNMEFIAHAREDIDRLRRMVERLREALEHAITEIDYCMPWLHTGNGVRRMRYEDAIRALSESRVALIYDGREER